MRHWFEEPASDILRLINVLALKNLWLNVTLFPLLDGFGMCVFDMIASLYYVEKNVYYKCYIKE